jgi:hypothetical protein
MKILLAILVFAKVSFGGVILNDSQFYGTIDTTLYDAVATSQKISLSARCVLSSGTAAGADLFAKGFEYNNSLGLWDIQYTGAAAGLDFVYGNGTAHLWRTTDAIVAGQLLQVIVTFAYGTGSSLVLYTNGVSMSGTWVAGDGSQAAIAQTEQVFIGAAGFTPLRYWQGMASDCAVWNTVLNFRQLGILQSSHVKRVEIQIATASLLGYWPCDEGSTVAIDYSQYRNKSCCVYRGGGSSNPPISDGIERVCSYPPNE